MRHYNLSLEVPFRLGENATFGQARSAFVGGRAPLLVADVVLLTLPIPDATSLSPVFFATLPLASALRELTGLGAREFTLQVDEQMAELGEFDGEEPPELECFDVTGVLGKDDFSLQAGVPGMLVSQRALSVLREFDLGIARIQAYSP